MLYYIIQKSSINFFRKTVISWWLKILHSFQEFWKFLFSDFAFTRILFFFGYSRDRYSFQIGLEVTFREIIFFLVKGIIVIRNLLINFRLEFISLEIIVRIWLWVVRCFFRFRKNDSFSQCLYQSHLSFA